MAYWACRSAAQLEGATPTEQGRGVEEARRFPRSRAGALFDLFPRDHALRWADGHLEVHAPFTTSFADGDKPTAWHALDAETGADAR